MQPASATAEACLSPLPEERRAVVPAVLRNLPEGCVEEVRSGMLSYETPPARYPGTYNRQPLMYAAHESHYALHSVGAYSDPEHARSIAGMPSGALIERHEAARRR